MNSKFIVLICWFMSTLIFTSGCGIFTISTPDQDNNPTVEAEIIYPTPAGNLKELIKDLASNDELVRYVSAFALEKYGQQAVLAVPALIINLYYQDSYEVRQSAAWALGKIGPGAKEAVPDLINVLINDEMTPVSEFAAIALGEIGDKSAVPFLADCLYSKDGSSGLTIANVGLPIHSAEAIAKLTGEKFTEYPSSYSYNKEGVPHIVADARKWWEEEGQYQDWSTMK